VVHQTGQKTQADVAARYGELGLAARVVPFIHDMASALAAAHLVVSRSGASSLAEICAVGRPSLLVPYPFAADDHQYRNAKSLEEAGAAIALRQSDATAERIAAEIAALDPARLAEMAVKARERGKPEAARLVAEDLLGVAREHAAKRGRAGPEDVLNTNDRSHREEACSAGA
jgi:UDP-N-acetylglucosamine--N-acetylmuramyl-(pentapeptide) pyrophosphoryl-undecaprenol N-acetylglucosamine transferase